MTEITAARYGTKWGYADSETGWGIGVNHDLSMIDTIICAYVLSATTGTPPSTPTDGDTYFIPSSGVAGVWIGHEGSLVAWMNSAWRYFSVPVGFRARFASPAGFYYWNGAAWVDEAAGTTAVTSVAGRTGAVVIALSDISGAAPLSSPAFTGTPTAPTAATGTNSTQVATTAYVQSALVVGTVTSVAGRSGVVTLAVADISGAAPLASPALTGNPTAPTQTAGNNSTRLATTAYVDTADALKANLASPALTGNPTAPTQTAGNNSTRLATTAYADAAAAAAASGVTAPVSSVAGRTGAVTLAVADVTGAAPLASPTFTGSPAAPTQTAGDNSTKLASTAYADAAALAARIWNAGSVTTVGSGLSLVGGTLTASGGGGGGALSAITAATGANTLASGDNAQAWNWTLTTAAKSAFAFGETAAATNGAGSQWLVDVGTLAASTAGPFRVSARASAVMTISSVGALTYTVPSVSSGTGNAITLTAGLTSTAGGSSTGGAVSIAAGAGTTASTNSGGAVSISGGAGVLNGGAVNITSGATSSAGTGGTSGAVNIASGSAGPNQAGSGAVSITTANGINGLFQSSGNSGAITIQTGTATGGSTPGSISLIAGANLNTSSGATWNVPGGSLNFTTGAAGYQNANGGDFNVTLGVKAGTGRDGVFKITSLPTSDPSVTGALWLTSSGQIAVSGTTQVLPYDIGFYIEGVMTAAEEIFRFVAPRAFTLPAGSNFAVAKALTAATGSAVITIYKNGVSCATLTWAAAGTVATVASASGASIAIGDVISANGPGTPDPTLANIAVTLAGAR